MANLMTILYLIWVAIFLIIMAVNALQNKIETRKCILYSAILMYHRDVRRYGGDIFVMPADVYSGASLMLPWNWKLCRMMPEAKFRIIESYI